MDLLVNFKHFEQNSLCNHQNNGYKNEYNEATNKYYKALRFKKSDPITFDNLNDVFSFKYPYIWNPLNGNILKENDELVKDPYGSLYFNPTCLLKYFYENSKKGLWIDGTDDYSGSYGEFLGTGEDIEIIGRGIYPERYLFRLPIVDCYYKPNQKMNIITMGPKLTEKEIKEIDTLLIRYYTNDPVYKKYYYKIGSLYNLKCFYDIALSKKPLTEKKKKLDSLKINSETLEDILENHDNPNYALNMYAVRMILKMHDIYSRDLEY
jgi:hypothetical protein